MRLALALAALALLPGPAAAQVIPTADPGRLERFTLPTPEGEADYLVYTPSTVDGSQRVPLYVMTHGCNTTALEQAMANLHHPVAERERFVVLYPDFAAASHPARCWRWFDPTSQQRDGGDPAVIAAQTRAVLERDPIDPARVYAMGMSSGAFITSVLGAAYPELYAAIGIMAGGPYMTYACLADDRGLPREPVETPLLADRAHAAQGERARLVPVLEVHGDADGTVPPACGEQAVEQWLRTGNLALSGTQDRPLALTPAATRTVAEPGRRSAEVREYRDGSGCLVAEKWTVAGMDHFWSGGTTDPVYAEFTDPTGPNAAELSWAFFRRFRMGPVSCERAPAAPRPAAACRFTVRLPRGLRAVRATAAGKRMRVRGRRVLVDVAPRPLVQVVVTARDRRSRSVRVVRRYRRCA